MQIPQTDTTLIVNNSRQFKSIIKELEKKDSTLKQVRRDLGISRRKIKTLTIVNNTTKFDTILKTVYDTLSDKRTITLDDRYISLYAEAGKDSSCVDLTINNKIRYFEVKNTKLFKPTEYEVYFHNSNPYINTDKVQTFTLKPKPKRVSIGPQVGIGVNGNPTVSLGVQWSLIRL